MIPRHSRPSAALAVRTTRRTHLLRSSRGCTRSRGAFDAFACSRGGSGSQVAVSRQDCPLVVPAEVALDRLYVLTLHGAGQGVRTARTEELAASAHLQLSLDRAGVHRHLLQTAAGAPALSPALWSGTSPHACITLVRSRSARRTLYSYSIGRSWFRLHVREREKHHRCVPITAYEWMRRQPALSQVIPAKAGIHRRIG